MTTRAPAVLKINSQNAGMQGNDKINSHISGIRGYHFQKSNGWERELEWRLVVNLKRSWQVLSAQALFKHVVILTLSHQSFISSQGHCSRAAPV